MKSTCLLAQNKPLPGLGAGRAAEGRRVDREGACRPLLLPERTCLEPLRGPGGGGGVQCFLIYNCRAPSDPINLEAVFTKTELRFFK